MQKLIVLFFLTLSLLGVNSSIYAAQDGAQAADQQKTTTDEGKKKKKGEDEEEPECE